MRECRCTSWFPCSGYHVRVSAHPTSHASFPCTQNFTQRTHAPSHIPRYITTHRIFLPLLLPSPDGGDLLSWNAMSSLGYRFNMRVARY